MLMLRRAGWADLVGLPGGVDEGNWECVWGCAVRVRVREDVKGNMLISV